MTKKQILIFFIVGLIGLLIYESFCLKRKVVDSNFTQKNEYHSKPATKFGVLRLQKDESLEGTAFSFSQKNDSGAGVVEDDDEEEDRRNMCDFNASIDPRGKIVADGRWPNNQCYELESDYVVIGNLFQASIRFVKTNKPCDIMGGWQSSWSFDPAKLGSNGYAYIEVQGCQAKVLPLNLTSPVVVYGSISKIIDKKRLPDREDYIGIEMSNLIGLNETLSNTSDVNILITINSFEYKIHGSDLELEEDERACQSKSCLKYRRPGIMLDILPGDAIRFSSRYETPDDTLDNPVRISVQVGNNEWNPEITEWRIWDYPGAKCLRF